jgi:hypothetical protein
MVSEMETGSGLRLGMRTKSRAAAPLASVVQAFEQLRERLHVQMAILEALARQRGSSQSSDLDRELCDQRAQLQRERAALKAERDRIERERHVMLEKLEHDRQLLAEAWNNLEREQMRMAAPVADDRRAMHSAQRAPVPIPASASAQSETVTQAVLEHFHTLRRDVRKNTRSKA